MLWRCLKHAEQEVPPAVAVALPNGADASMKIVCACIHGPLSAWW
jgi:hypothetical protein